MAVPPQQFCVRWNSYHTNLQSWFPRVLLSEQFADVTLACESRQLRCHKLVLSACSAYLERLLAQNPCKHPIVLMRDMRFSEMQALVDFMYKGEVNVTQDELPSLLKSAEALQIRGLCSSESGSLVSEGGQLQESSPRSPPVSNNGTSTQHNTHNNHNVNGAPLPPSKPFSPPKKKETDVKEETVEEDGLYYGELDHDQMEYQEDEDPGKPSSSLGQTSDISTSDPTTTQYAIANVQCQYDDSPSDTEDERGGLTVTAGGGGGGCITDHTYNSRDEPPAFIIHQSHIPPVVTQKIMTLAPEPGTGVGGAAGGGYPTLNVIHVGDRPPHMISPSPEYNISKRIRRSEVVLRQAADCVSRGLTFQTVSEQFNIPISTIRFFMARKGILPRRRRGRSTLARPSTSPEPPYHMQHYKLPDMLAFKTDDEENNDSCQ